MAHKNMKAVYVDFKNANNFRRAKTSVILPSLNCTHSFHVTVDDVIFVTAPECLYVCVKTKGFAVTTRELPC